MENGWMCPACGSAHAPTVQTCPRGAAVYPWTPTLPLSWSPAMRCERCGSYGVHTCLSVSGSAV